MTGIINDVVFEIKIDTNIEKIEDIMENTKYNVMSTPALGINEKIILKGRIPNKTEVLERLKNLNQTDGLYN